MIQSLQVFRGLAALAVVAHHAVLSTESFVSVLPPQVESVLGMGYLGVDFFFVLSGFIIMYVHMDDERTGQAVRLYAFKRLVRLYSPYLPISIAMITLYLLLPGFSASGGRDFSVASSLLLLPADSLPALSVAWTLVHELQFYAVFLVFYLSRRFLVGFLLLWFGVILVGNLSYTPVGWERYPLSLLNIEFMFGVLAAWMIRCTVGRVWAGWYALVGAALVMTVLAIITLENDAYLRLVFAFGVALVVMGFTLLERVSLLPWPGQFLLIGNASYSIYLIHNPLLSVTQRFAGWLEFGAIAALAFGMLVSVLAGLVYHKLIELPALAFFRSRMTGV